MFRRTPMDLDIKSAPFDRFRGLHPLAAARSGHASGEAGRHQLYVAEDERTAENVVIKVASRPGLVYERELTNEIASLTTINSALPGSRYFPVLGDHGRLRDGRAYLTMSYFEEWPLATSISTERHAAIQAAHVRTTIEVAKALGDLHGLEIWHVDLNPMNVLSRWESGRPVIRIVDFESSYETARHAKGVFYNPPTTTGFSAPELSHRAPDARADLFSLGAVLYTIIAGYGWTWTGNVGEHVDDDPALVPELKEFLLTAVDADPDRRFPSAAEFRGALTVCLERISTVRS